MAQQPPDSFEAHVDRQLAELRAMLLDSSNHHRTVVRPSVIVGASPSGKVARGGPGPVTVVTFYISHRPQESAATGDAVHQRQLQLLDEIQGATGNLARMASTVAGGTPEA